MPLTVHVHVERFLTTEVNNETTQRNESIVPLHVMIVRDRLELAGHQRALQLQCVVASTWTKILAWTVSNFVHVPRTSQKFGTDRGPPWFGNCKKLRSVKRVGVPLGGGRAQRRVRPHTFFQSSRSPSNYAMIAIVLSVFRVHNISYDVYCCLPSDV